MKNYLKSLMFAVVSTFILSSCDDVPSPYPMPINEGDNPAAIVEPAGEGTLESPYNVAYVRQICGDLEQTTDNSDKKLSPEIYVKGIVSKVETDGKNAWSSQYGNITYYISDDGKSANEFEVYRGLGLDGAKFASQDGVNVGDEVVVCGKVLNFKGTYEFDQGSKLVSINGSGSNTPQDAIEVTCAEAVELINALADNGTSTETYSVTGYITEVIGSVSTKTGSPQQSFWLADTKDGGQVLQAYYANVPDGVSAFTVGSKVKITGQLTKYVKNDAVTPEIKNPTVEILEAGDDGGDTDTPVDPAGTGTSTDPYNVAKIKQLISESNAPTGEIYIKGKISQIKSLDVSKYTRAQYYISDNGSTTNQFYVYNGLYLGGANFTANDQIKVGDDVVILGTLGTYQGDYQVAQNSKIVSLNGNTADDNNDNNDDNNGDNGDETSDTPVEGMTITSSLIVSGATGSVVLDTNKYGSQAVATTSTWYTFKVNGATFTGCRICIATEANGGGIQMQGNASDASKQGFITNVTPFKPISSIKLVFRTTSGSTYEPGFNLYVGTTTHPTGTAVTGDKETSESDGFKTYTYTYDVSSNNYTFFTIANDLVGALYLDQIVVETK